MYLPPKTLSMFAVLATLIGTMQVVEGQPNTPAATTPIEMTQLDSALSTGTITHGKTPKVALALGGGGCKALAEIGVLKVFEKNHIPIDYIIGTSVGAIIGALYAGGVPLADIQQMATTGTLQRALVPNVLPKILLLPLKKLTRIGRKKTYAGLTDGSKLNKLLHKYLPDDFSQLKKPFAAVATNLETGNTCMINSGDLCNAVVASSAIPPLTRPINVDGILYMDGGLRSNLPTNCAQMTAADVIIAVPADAPIKQVDKHKFTSLRKLVGRITDIMESEIDGHRWKDANLVIYPDIAETPAMTKDPDVVKRTIAAGEAAATEALPRLHSLINFP